GRTSPGASLELPSPGPAGRCRAPRARAGRRSRGRLRDDRLRALTPSLRGPNGAEVDLVRRRHERRAAARVSLESGILRDRSLEPRGLSVAHALPDSSVPRLGGLALRQSLADARRA